jgi:hypothetical protein
MRRHHGDSERSQPSTPARLRAISAAARASTGASSRNRTIARLRSQPSTGLRESLSSKDFVLGSLWACGISPPPPWSIGIRSIGIRSIGIIELGGKPRIKSWGTTDYRQNLEPQGVKPFMADCFLHCFRLDYVLLFSDCAQVQMSHVGPVDGCGNRRYRDVAPRIL